MTGAAVDANGPAQLITAAAPASARSSEPGSSTDATRYADPAAASRPASRPTRSGTNPRDRNSATTNRPVCPYAPNTATV